MFDTAIKKTMTKTHEGQSTGKLNNAPKINNHTLGFLVSHLLQFISHVFRFE